MRVCSTVIVQANVTGLTEAAEKVAHLGVPKVSMSFKLDRNGIVRVQRAEATIEEIIPPAPEEEEEQAAAGDDEDQQLFIECAHDDGGDRQGGNRDGGHPGATAPKENIPNGGKDREDIG